MTTKNDQKYINRCFELAKRGLGLVAPNPLVGSVIVQKGEVIGEGYHQKYGEAHAEPNAIKDALSKGHKLKGATLYCNLEPCCHTNKQTPPCADHIIKCGFSRVVICNLDPNPNVAGQGLQKIKDSGVEVLSGVLESEGLELNKVFFKFIQTGLPYIHIKVAQTLDGRIATSTGNSKWISDEGARRIVHEWRLKYDAVLVGRNTLEKDNPSLTIRMEVDSKGKIPYRIIIGSVEKMNPKLKLFSDEYSDRTIVITFSNKDHSLSKNIKVIRCTSLEEALLSLGKLKISSILAEGGTHLLSSLLEKELWDEFSTFICPKIIGSGNSFYRSSKELMSEAIKFETPLIEVIGDQVLYTVKNRLK